LFPLVPIIAPERVRGLHAGIGVEELVRGPPALRTLCGKTLMAIFADTMRGNSERACDVGS
jgi:hypothetical protein